MSSISVATVPGNGNKVFCILLAFTFSTKFRLHRRPDPVFAPDFNEISCPVSRSGTHNENQSLQSDPYFYVCRISVAWPQVSRARAPIQQSSTMYYTPNNRCCNSVCISQ